MSILYRVFFTTGLSILINEWQFSVIQSALTTTGDPVYMRQGDEPYIMVHIKNITHIVPEQEAKSGVAGRPTPDDLKYQKQKDKEELLKDPNMILKRAVEKDEQH